LVLARCRRSNLPRSLEHQLTQTTRRGCHEACEAALEEARFSRCDETRGIAAPLLLLSFAALCTKAATMSGMDRDWGARAGGGGVASEKGALVRPIDPAVPSESHKTDPPTALLAAATAACGALSQASCLVLRANFLFGRKNARKKQKSIGDRRSTSRYDSTRSMTRSYSTLSGSTSMSILESTPRPNPICNIQWLNAGTYAAMRQCAMANVRCRAATVARVRRKIWIESVYKLRSASLHSIS
jgi:hypothetical protein